MKLHHEAQASAYGMLRHALHSSNSALPGLLSIKPHRDLALIPFFTLRLEQHVRLLEAGADPGALLAGCRGGQDTLAALWAICNTESQLGPRPLLERLGESPLLDAQISRLVRKAPLEQVSAELGDALAEELETPRGDTRLLALLLNMTAETRTGSASDDDLCTIMGNSDDTVLLLSALRCAGRCGRSSLAGEVGQLAVRLGREDPTIMVACAGALAGMRTHDSQKETEKMLALMERGPGSAFPALVREFVMLAGCAGSAEDSHQTGVGKKPRVLVQTISEGDPTLSGRGQSGGLGVFLSGVGKVIGSSHEWDRVYTMVPVCPDAMDSSSTLLTDLSDGHTLLRVPMSFRAFDARSLLLNRSEIRTSYCDMLDLLGIYRPVIHVRYANDAALETAELAREKDSALVYTLTADPHRSLELYGDSQSPGRDALLDLHRVCIADRIVHLADGIAGIGDDANCEELQAFFPKLLTGSCVASKPFRMIPEGIEVGVETEEAVARVHPRQPIIDSVLRSGPKYSIDRSLLERPLMLNVGRLSLLKGQAALVEAWSESELSERYNLVLIGGNIEAPDEGEREVMDDIESIMRRRPELVGRFCHAAALSNKKVREFERQAAIAAPQGPSVYVCPSAKEEFGIAILEAMSAGFLCFGPERGGVSSYIDHGKNGFLLDTATSESIRAGLEDVLLMSDQELKALGKAARAGQSLVRREFTIYRAAQSLDAFYREVTDEVGLRGEHESA
jgi:glycosyltransferase involved in cell wall biosynthesis